MVEAMLQGWRAQQTALGLRAKTIDAREGLVRRFLAFTSEFPWQWSASHVDEWTLTAEHHLAPATSSHRICQVSVVIWPRRQPHQTSRPPR